MSLLVWLAFALGAVAYAAALEATAPDGDLGRVADLAIAAALAGVLTGVVVLLERRRERADRDYDDDVAGRERDR